MGRSERTWQSERVWNKFMRSRRQKDTIRVMENTTRIRKGEREVHQQEVTGRRCFVQKTLLPRRVFPRLSLLFFPSPLHPPIFLTCESISRRGGEKDSFLRAVNGPLVPRTQSTITSAPQLVPPLPHGPGERKINVNLHHCPPGISCFTLCESLASRMHSGSVI